MLKDATQVARRCGDDAARVRGRRDDLGMSARVVYLSMPDLVERYAGVWSRWALYEHVAAGLLPHVKLPGRRGLLFRLDDLERYEAGDIDLEVVKLPNGGRLCRPRSR